MEIKQITTQNIHSFNLCPICGRESESTDIICPHHSSITYDSNGRVILYSDFIFRSNSFTVQRS